VPANATVGNSTITLRGTSGSVPHDAPAVTLGITPAIQTSQNGTVLYLQSVANGHTARIGLDTKWGGAIVEVSLDGTNFVNAHDTGREVQPALYDAKDAASANGWDSVLAGDKYDHGSPASSIGVQGAPEAYAQWYRPPLLDAAGISCGIRELGIYDDCVQIQSG
jgi:hypothetical protein